MDLREYLFRKRMSSTDFAKLLGCERSYLSKIVNRKMKPGKYLAKAIVEATNGEVSYEELMSDQSS
jgi:transcriptional regulator with XRE-family HTH domain